MGAFTIAGKDLRLRLRDKSAWIIAFVAPFALAAIISFAFKGEEEFHIAIVMADEDNSGTSKSFIGALTTPDAKKTITLRVVESAVEAERLTEREVVSAGLVIPAGFEQSVIEGANPAIIAIKHPNSLIAGSIAENIARRFASETNSVRLAVSTALSAGGGGVAADRRYDLGAPEAANPPNQAGPGERPEEIVSRASQRAIPTSLQEGALGTRGRNASSSYFAPAMAIFFVFFTVSFGGISLLQERRLGTMQRLIAAPIARGQIIAGKVLSTFVLGVVSLGSMVVFTSLLLGADWGDPLAVAALVLATVFAAIGITAMVAVLSTTEERAGALSSIVVLALSLLGGNFMPISQAPKIFRSMALFTPNGWALRGFTDLVADGGRIASVGPHIAVISGFGLVTGLIALSQTRKLT